MDIGQIWIEAHTVASEAYRIKVRLLEKKGPRWAVIDEVRGTMDELCGFVQIVVKPANRRPNSQLVKWLKAAGIGGKHYHGGYSFSAYHLGAPGQGIESKEAAARAAVEVLEKYGFSLYVESRLD